MAIDPVEQMVRELRGSRPCKEGLFSPVAIMVATNVHRSQNDVTAVVNGLKDLSNKAVTGDNILKTVMFTTQLHRRDMSGYGLPEAKEVIDLACYGALAYSGKTDPVGALNVGTGSIRSDKPVKSVSEDEISYIY
ncbi:MAG: hypothetical protein HYS81_02915 [Candidatus Aenigmatarchaeota archaeon]|nr:MAG: hypothetical protein HYS81_02915 [Candidatus Aenigmarchaeota archaeon]